MSTHNALRPNLTQEQKNEIEKFLTEKLKGRDFVLVMLEHPTSFIATNQDTVKDARKILSDSLAKPWS